MAVPSIITDLSSTAALNSPAGTDAIGNTLDDYLRSTQAILKAQFSSGSAISVTGATMTVPVTGSYFSVTGSGTISVTGLSTNFAGRVATLYFADGNLTLVNGASLVLPGGANITVAAGDIAVMVNETGNIWKCVSYTPGVSVTAKRYISTLSSNAQTQIDTANTNISTANSNISTLQTQMGTANTNIGTLQTQMTTANSNIASNTTSISTLQSQMTTANSNISTLQTQMSAVSSVPTGSVHFFAMSSAPSGYLEANGSAVSRTTYAALFGAIGTTYGAGDGSTTFTLPDLRGQFIRGWDHSAGVDSGRVFGSSQSDAFQGHAHTFIGSRNDYTGASGSNVAAYGVGRTTTGITTDGTNGTPRTAAETRPKNVALLPCIKT